MSGMESIKCFFLKGISTFRQASSGRYNDESGEVRKIREEVFNARHEASETEDLRSDYRNVVQDLRIGFNKIVLANG